MLLHSVKRLLTATRAVDGTWIKKSPIEIEDSFLGLLTSEEPVEFDSGGVTHTTNIMFRKQIEFDGSRKLQVSFLDNDDLDGVLKLTRRLIAGLRKKDYWYRLVLAWHHRDLHRLMSEEPVVSTRTLASLLEPYLMKVWANYPDDRPSAEIWYSAGRLLGGARVCIVLDERGRYTAAGMG